MKYILLFLFAIIILLPGCKDEGLKEFIKGESYFNGDAGLKDYELATTWYRKSADKGYCDAMIKLGMCYAEGLGVRKDAASAVAYYQKAMECGSTTAPILLAEICLSTTNIEINVTAVAQRLIEIGQYDNGDAYYLLARMYNGEYIESLEAESGMKYMKLAADKGHLKAKYSYAFGAMASDDPRTVATGKRYMIDAAEADCMDAQEALAIFYAGGFLVEKDDVEALKWEKRAAKNGSAKCLCNLGVRYWNGNHVPRNRAEALQFFVKADAVGDAHASFILGRSYYDGNEIEKNYERAFAHFKKAAEAGHVDAMFFYAYLCFHGAGCEPDHELAYRWYHKAAVEGHNDSQRMLGLIYLNGDGVLKDVSKARYWLKKASEGGNTLAMKALVTSYYDKKTGEWSNVAEAKYFTQKAIDAGDEDAKKLLEIIR